MLRVFLLLHYLYIATMAICIYIYIFTVDGYKIPDVVHCSFMHEETLVHKHGL